MRYHLNAQSSPTVTHTTPYILPPCADQDHSLSTSDFLMQATLSVNSTLGSRGQ
ncbi:hypothetical protein CIHG_07762 [Coccidioides immitis H538.4]|uniref:Uncharacterized protein n=1 Tax=Coccidioides immitis H538.4 TaxID=396776 RepID=A0A0J8S009_COCIT|nr:hypothetical protein CIHG_07762 [Coccidioides immitis H538.4]